MTYNVFSGTLNPTHFTLTSRGAILNFLLDNLDYVDILCAVLLSDRQYPFPQESVGGSEVDVITGSVIRIPFSALKLLVDGKKGRPSSLQNLSVVPKCLLWNNWRKKVKALTGK